MKSVKDEYKKYLQTISGTEIYNNFKEILYSKNDSLVSYFNNEILKEILPEQNQIKICDIGGGDAKRLKSIGSLLTGFDSNRNLSLDIIEQSREFCSQAKMNLSKNNPFYKVNIFNQLFENYSTDSKYNLIFLIHSIFAFQDTNSIIKVFNSLAEDGKVILFSNAPDSFLATLKQLIDAHFKDTRFEINEIENLLLKSEVDFDKYQFDTEWAVKSNEFETKMELILEWLSLGHFKNFSSKQKSKMFNKIIDLSYYKDGSYLFKEKEEILSIPFDSKLLQQGFLHSFSESENI